MVVTKRLALFDFDGTITTRHSAIDFVLFMVHKKKIIIGSVLLLPFVLLYFLRFISNKRMKETVLTVFFKGWDADLFKRKSTLFATTKLPHIIREETLDRIKWHKERGDTVVVVSASIPDYLKVWCDSQNLQLVATELEVKNGKLTGKLASENCYGKGKLNLIKQKFNLDEYEYIYAYGNDKGDQEMLAIANESFYREF